jgi:hypothetical protein
VTPQWDQHLHTQAAKPLDPGALGQRSKQTRGQVFIPAPHPAQFGVGTTPEERGKHHTDDLAQQLFLTSQTPFDLGHEVFGETQGMESLLQGLGGLLCLAAITCEALLGFEVATLAGFGVLFGGSVAWGHGALLNSVWVCEDGVTAASYTPTVLLAFFVQPCAV